MLTKKNLWLDRYMRLSADYVRSLKITAGYSKFQAGYLIINIIII